MNDKFIIYPKVNLCLNIIGKRKFDKLHELSSVIFFLRPFSNFRSDEIFFEDADKFSLQINGRDKELVNQEFIINAIEKIIPINVIKEKITINKNLPIGGGIGGGSADIALILNYLVKKYKIENKNLDNIFFEIGSDVPVCIKKSAYFVTGAGERLTKIHSKLKYFTLLINPNIHLYTNEMFSQVKSYSAENITLKRGVNNLFSYIKDRSNDFLPIALKKNEVIENLFSMLQNDKDIIHANMSGSGSTFFAMYTSKSKLLAGAMKYRRYGFWTMGGELV